MLPELSRQVEKVLEPDKSFDIIKKNTKIGGKNACYFFVDGFMKDSVMERLLDFFISIDPQEMEKLHDAQSFADSQIPYIEVELSRDKEKIVQQVLSGPTAFFIDGYEDCILMDVRTYPARSPEEPQKEQTMRGARDGFVETIVFNTAMIRRRIRDPKLVFDMHTVGNRSKTDVVVGYISDYVDQELLKKVEDTLEKIDVKSLVMGQQSLVESLIKSKFFNPFPKVRLSERPDVAAASILDGKIILIVDNSPNCIILPTTIFDFIQEPGDYYFSPVVGGYLRLVRNGIFATTLFLTPLWYLLLMHGDALPQWLQIVKVNEPNAVPILVQLLILEIAIDGLKIASLNTPDILSNSLSIIGALLLGEFAVEVGWFVPETILYMAYITIAGFTQPSVELGYAVKFMRILLLLLTAWLDLAGFIGGIVLIFILLASNKTINKKGYLYPLIPFNGHEFKVQVLRMKLKSKRNGR